MWDVHVLITRLNVLFYLFLNVAFVLKIFVHLLECQNYGVGERERKRENLVVLFSLQMAAAAGPAGNQEPETPSESPRWVAGVEAIRPSLASFLGILLGR